MADKSFIPLNFEIIGNPINWIIIIMMLLIVGFGLHMILPSLNLVPTMHRSN